MEKIVTLVICLLIYSFTYGQIENKKIKIALLGSIHFTPSTQDEYSNEGLILTTQKQTELEEVISRLVAFKPDQICIEVPGAKQAHTDAQYQEYLKGNRALKINEIDLLGFQTAKRLALPKLTCINYLGKFDSQPMKTFAEQHGQGAVLQELDAHAREFVNEVNEKQKKLSIRDNLIALNSPEALNKNLAFYTKYYVSIGKGDEYTGTNLVADWYDTNLHIYTNILRAIQPNDKTILVIFGQGHIPILKHLFESNPDFEVIKIEVLLD
ncbi:MAG TPA: DUF5694 domain-containing protein [Ohtaekwangia sp.]|nr:DUF5694 domain-containing protein [Ohtaekwangia sp.]